MEEIYLGQSHGSLGEIFQGPAILGDEIVVLSPRVPKTNQVLFTANSQSSDCFNIVNEDCKPKLFRGMKALCKKRSLPFPSGKWYHCGHLPVGHGFSSSTADIIAGLRCIANVYNFCLCVSEIQAVLKGLERSDGIMFDCLSLYSSSHHRLIGKLNSDFIVHALYMIDDEMPLCTECLSDALWENYHQNRNEYKLLKEKINLCIKSNNVAGLCKCSTRSALLNQHAVKKRNFDNIYQKKEFFQADGIIIAHTGNILGYIFIDKPSNETTQGVEEYMRSLGGKMHYTEIF